MIAFKSSIHPGKILADEFEEIVLTISQLVPRFYVTQERPYNMAQGNANLTRDNSFKLGSFFSTCSELNT